MKNTIEYKLCWL